MVRDEAGRDEVVAGRRLPARCSDGHLPVPLVLVEPIDVDRPTAQVDHDLAVRRAELHGLGGNPAVGAVRAHRDADPVPGLAVGAGGGAHREEHLGAVVGPELVHHFDHGRVRVRRLTDADRVAEQPARRRERARDGNLRLRGRGRRGRRRGARRSRGGRLAGAAGQRPCGQHDCRGKSSHGEEN